MAPLAKVAKDNACVSRGGFCHVLARVLLHTHRTTNTIQWTDLCYCIVWGRRILSGESESQALSASGEQDWIRECEKNLGEKSLLHHATQDEICVAEVEQEMMVDF